MGQGHTGHPHWALAPKARQITKMIDLNMLWMTDSDSSDMT